MIVRAENHLTSCCTFLCSLGICWRWRPARSPARGARRLHNHRFAGHEGHSENADTRMDHCSALCVLCGSPPSAFPPVDWRLSTCLSCVPGDGPCYTLTSGHPLFPLRPHAVSFVKDITMPHTQDIFAPIDASDIGRVRQLLDMDASLVHVRHLAVDQDGSKAKGFACESALGAAAKAGHLDIVKLLLERGAEVYDVAP